MDKKKIILQEKDIDVVVTGRNYSNILTMARALGKAGYTVEVLRVFKTKPSKLNLLRLMKPEAYSKFIQNYTECIADNNPDNIVNKLLEMKSETKKKLLVPVDDYLVGVVDDALDQLKDFFYIPSIKGKAGEINRLMDKDEQRTVAKNKNMPVLNSVLIKSQNGEFSIPNEVRYPCFVKPNISMNSTKSHMKKCDSYDDLKNTLTKFCEKGDVEMLVEDYADIKHEYSILGLSYKGTTVAPCMFKVVEGGHKERTGVTLIGETVDCNRYQKIIKKCCEFVTTLSYDGIFDIDLIETKDEKIYFIEINFRAGASMDVFTQTGVNLGKMLADAFIKDISIDTDVTSSCDGDRFVSEKILIEEFARGDANRQLIKKYMDECKMHFIKDKEDIKPYKYFRKYYFVAGAMQLLYKIKR